jgi:hypothetical protein
MSAVAESVFNKKGLSVDEVFPIWEKVLLMCDGDVLTPRKAANW